MSEPNAGSDVVSMKLKADKKGKACHVLPGQIADVNTVSCKSRLRSSKPLRHGAKSWLYRAAFAGLCCPPGD